jgi:hypothetical protein
LNQTANNITAVTVTPKTGAGAVTAIYYEGTEGTTYTKSTTRPTNAGKYLVTFDVAEATNWHAASDLPAGTLTITLATLTGNVSITNTGTIYVGTALNASYTGGSESVTYAWHKDGATTAIATGATYTPTEAGTYTVTVSAVGYASETSAAVTVNAITLSSISITGPNTTTYIIGETYSTDGLVVTAHYNNGSTADVTASATLNPNTVSTASAGTTPVTVSYQGHTATFTVTVNAVPAFTPNPPAGATVLYVAATANPSATPNPLVTWADAVTIINDASSGTNFAIIVTQNISKMSHTSSTFTKANLTLYLAGKTGAESISSTGEGNMLRTYANHTFIMEGLTLKGSTSNNNNVLVHINGGNFIMNSGEISGNKSTNSNYGGGVHVLGTFTMNGGKISGNTTAGSGGGVFVSGGATFTMNGGEISGNTSSSNGGGVFVASTGSTGIFRISNGSIYGNNAGTDSNTAPSGAALQNGGTAEYGTFSNPGNDSSWTKTTGDGKLDGNLITTNDTIRVVNGALQ